ncbi:MAG: hypothetical protein SFX72_15880 [Isosphaeraceae bacterium]|nr:hypothetical protein [Isosphaeraceae bacterium]
MSELLRLPKDQLACLLTEDVQQYLSSRHWKRDEESSTAKASIYHHPDLPDAEAVVPGRRELADYVERMGDVVQILSAVEERSAWQVLADLSSPPADVLRLQVSGADLALGTLPLSEGIGLIEGARGLLLAAACSARQPASFFPRQTYKEAVEFLQACRLGQTERGSFVAKILAPVPPLITRQSELFEEDDESLLPGEPFARRSTVGLMNALGYIRAAIDEGEYSRILDGVGFGVSANLCEAIASMRPESDQSDLRISMTWSSSRPRVPKAVKNVVDFSTASIEIIRESGRRLLDRFSATRERIEGRVINLKADSSHVVGFKGKVTLRVRLNGETTRVQFDLEPDDYRRACDAHRDGRAVAVTGLLQQEAKQFRLLQPQDFSTVES